MGLTVSEIKPETKRIQIINFSASIELAWKLPMLTAYEVNYKLHPSKLPQYSVQWNSPGKKKK